MSKKIETREIKVNDIQIRELEDGKRVIEGMIPYNSRSEWMGFFEYIEPTAFNKTLADGSDVRALWNHDTTKLLGRVKNGSLRLRSEDDGLHIECDLPKTSYAEDVYNLIREGYNNGLSFGFTTIKDKWGIEEVEGREVEVCHLIEVRLFEVSFCVSFPAYEATDSEARNIRSILDDISKIRPEDLSEEERQAINTSLRGLVPEEESKPALTEDTSAGEPTEAAEEQERQLDEFLADLRRTNHKE